MPDIEKAESTSKTPTSSLRREVGRPRIITSSYFVNESKKQELQYPNALNTYDCMEEDEAVFTSIDYTNIHVMNALYNAEFEGNRKSAASVAAADYLNYAIRNITHGTWWGFLQNATTDLKYGWSSSNIVLERRKYGQYSGSVCIKKLAPRDQKTIYAWLWDSEGREIIGWVQKPTISNLGYANRLSFLADGIRINQVYQSDGGDLSNDYSILKMDNLLHFAYNSTNNNPQGDTPLNHCYKAWKEKWLLEQLEVLAVQKDHGGMLLLRIPSELAERANDPETYGDEAALELADIQKDAAKLQSGEGGFMLLYSDADPATGNPYYDVQFKGVEGGGRQIETGRIIDQKRKSIYNCFGTGFLILGEDGGGSYAMSTTKSSTHGYYVERNITQKKDVIENQLVPKLLAANGMYLNWKDMPKLRTADPDEFDFDILSKFVQRVGSVNKLTPAMWEHLAKKARIPIDGIEDLDYTDKGDSRSGESKSTSGTGTSQAGGRASSINSANKALVKNMILDGDTLVDVQSGEEFKIQEDE
jgi:hypothetical protein